MTFPELMKNIIIIIGNEPSFKFSNNSKMNVLL